MRILVIPDVHLKSWIFEAASSIMADHRADRAVVLGDIVDDWGCEANEALYRHTLDAAIRFQEEHPDTLWCYGNHDLAYLWHIRTSGTSVYENVQRVVIKGLRELYNVVPTGHIGYVQRVDNVLFSHAGVSRMFVRDHMEGIRYENESAVIERINTLRMQDMWYDDSPIWLRPQRMYSGGVINMYRPRKLMQVVGHSPVKEVLQEGNLISCDTFSTYRDGRPFGNEEFCIVDTETWEWESVSDVWIRA